MEKKTFSLNTSINQYKQKISFSKKYQKIRNSLNKLCVNTVCMEAKCPNSVECFSGGNAAFLILGKICTRNCSFCGIGKGKPLPPDLKEPENVAEAVKLLNLEYVVITSVTRDDLPDGGAEFFVKTAEAIRRISSETKIEFLIPDFGGKVKSLKLIIKSEPNVINHNLETVPRLYPKICPKADYSRSLNLIRYVNLHSHPGDIKTKSGIMLGLGEKAAEVESLLEDLLSAGCKTLTIGQYFQPSSNHFPVHEYLHANQFHMWSEKALIMGFEHVLSGRFIRSSYNADLLFRK